LTDDEKEALAATVTVRTYRKGDIIARQGEILPSLMIVRAGIIVREHGDDAHPQEVGRLAPGDFFGETGLLAGIGETSTLRAMNHVVVYEIDQQSFAPLLLDRPEMAEDLAAVLSARMSSFGASDVAGQQHTRSKLALLKAMHSVFHTVPFRRVSSANGQDAQERKRP
jgi:CRP-like cAMP-binding protein